MQHLDAETLSSYIDYELPAGEFEQVEAHLASCQQCQRAYSELLGVSRLVRELPRYELHTPVHVQPGTARDKPSGPIDFMRYVRPLAVAAIVILVAITGFRIVSELADSEPDGGSPIQFAEEDDNGTDSQPPTSQSVADAPDAASDAEQQPPMAAVPRNEESAPARFDEDEAADSAVSGNAAMAPTAEAVIATPTVTVDDAGDTSGWSVADTVRTVLYAILGAAIIATAIWLLYKRTRRG